MKAKVRGAGWKPGAGWRQMWSKYPSSQWSSAKIKFTRQNRESKEAGKSWLLAERKSSSLMDIFQEFYFEFTFYGFPCGGV